MMMMMMMMIIMIMMMMIMIGIMGGGKPDVKNVMNVVSVGI